MSNFHYKINCCQSCSYQIAYAVNNEGVFMGPTQSPYILQLCMGPSYFWGVWPLLTPPLISHTEFTGLPHAHALCMTQHVVRIVYMRPGAAASGIIFLYSVHQCVTPLLLLDNEWVTQHVLKFEHFGWLITSDKRGKLCVCPRSFVCLSVC